MTLWPEDVSEIFGETPKKNNSELFTELNTRLASAKTKQEVDAITTEAKVLPESLLNILANMAKYKRNDLPDAVAEKAKEAAPMEVMNQCITLLNNSKSFEELQAVLADNKELYAKLNKWQNQIITGIIDELSKKLPATNTVVEVEETKPVVEAKQVEPAPVVEPTPVVETESKKRTRKTKEEATPVEQPTSPMWVRAQLMAHTDKVITINRRINLPINGVQYSNNESTYTITCSQSELDDAMEFMNKAIKKDTRLYTKEDFDKAVADAKKDTTYQAGVMDGIVTQNGGEELQKQLDLEIKTNEHYKGFLNQLAKDTAEVVFKNNWFEQSIMAYVREAYSTYCATNPNPKK